MVFEEHTPEELARQGAVPRQTHYVLADLRREGIAACPTVGHVISQCSIRPTPAHRHDELIEICYLALGERIYQRGSSVFLMHGGDLWINPPGELHGSCVHPSGGSNFYWLFLSPLRRSALFSRRASEHLWALFLRHGTGSYHAVPEVRELFGNLFALLASPRDAMRAERVRIIFSALLLAVADSLKHPGLLRSNAGIQRLLKELDALPESDSASVAELARRARMSESYFKARFRDTVGMPPQQYIKRRRLMHAARELAETDAPIADIAAAHGFCSSQHFTTAFRRFFCVTPMAYRRQKRG